MVLFILTWLISLHNMSNCKDYVPADEYSAARLAEIAGVDFLRISDTSAHTDLDCYSLYVEADTVFDTVIVGGVDVKTSKGMTGTVAAGVLFGFGKEACTSIKLTSGVVVANIR